MWAGEHFSQLSTSTRRAIMICIVMNTTVMVCFISPYNFRDTQRQFLENICSEDDLRFSEHLFLNFLLACTAYPKIFEPPQIGIINCHF